MSSIRKPITLYCKGWNAAGQVKPFRRVLHNCYYSEQGNMIASRTGVVLNQSVFLQIFLDPDFVYVPFAEWDKFTETEYAGKWSIELGTTASFFVPTVSEYEFSWGTLSTLTTAENVWINANGGKRIANIENNFRGNADVQHLSVRC